MNVICFGDSNTYGYDPRSFLGGRYDPEHPWADLLAAETGWTVYNLGLNGRRIPTSPPALPSGADLLILMLGSNDLLQGLSPEQAAERLELFLRNLPLSPKQILLIAPPPMALGERVPNQRLTELSHTYAQTCKALAQRLGIHFADAGDWGISLAYDGIHFTPDGHKAFAAGLLQTLSEKELSFSSKHRIMASKISSQRRDHHHGESIHKGE